MPGNAYADNMALLTAKFGGLSCATKFTFDEFVTGSSNQEAYEAARIFANTTSPISEPLTIIGDTGLGKTHLLMAIGHEALSRSPEKSVCYLNAREYLREWINLARINKLDDFIESTGDIDLLLFDNLNLICEADLAQATLFQILQKIHRSRGRIAIAANHAGSPDKFISVLSSFLEQGEIIKILPADVETRIACLELKFEEVGIAYSREALQFLSMLHIQTLREMLEFQECIISYAKLMKFSVSLKLAEELWNSYRSKNLIKIK